MKENKPGVLFYINTFFPFIGGAEKQVRDISSLLRKKGVDAFVVTRRYPGLKRKELIKDTPVYRLNCFGPKYLRIITFFISSFIFFFKHRDRYRIIHIFQMDSNTLLAVFFARLFGKKSIVKIACPGKIGEIQRSMSTFSGRMKLRYLRKGLDLITGTCDEAIKELKDNGFREKMIMQIPTTIDTGHFSPVDDAERSRLRESLQLPADKIVFLAVGRMVYQKGFDILIDVWKNVLSERRDALLCILGGGLLENELRERAKDVSSENIRLTGMIKNVIDYLRAGDVFIMPSRWEGMSNAFMEAMSTGLPVIISRVGGTELVRETNGIVVEPENMAELRDAILKMMGNKNNLRTMGMNSRKTVIDVCSIEKIVDRYIEVYKGL